MSDQTGLYQDGNSVFENVFIQGTLNVATTNEKIVVRSNGITIDNNSGTETLRIEPDGRVGIHSNIPAATLDIRDVGSTGPGILISGCTGTEGDLAVQDGQILHVGHFNSDTSTYTDRFRIDNTGVKEIVNGNLELNQEFIGFSGNFISGLLGETAPQQHAAIYRPQDNTLCFSTANSERLRIDSDGNVDIVAGHVSLNLGHGIDFSDTANGTGTTSSEVFDDYEEGSFTPSYNTSNSNIGTVTYDARSGRYIKVGRLCFVTIRMRTDSISSVGSGVVRITGLPFTHVNVANNRAITHNIFTSNWTSTDAPSLALIQNNTTHMRLYQKAHNEDVSPSSGLPVSALNTGSNDNDIRLTAIYETST